MGAASYTQEMKERAYAEVGGEEPRAKKTLEKTMCRYRPKKKNKPEKTE